MAKIYLTQKNNKKAYAKCYSDIVEKNPTLEGYVLLGDAHMNIQEVFSESFRR